MLVFNYFTPLSLLLNVEKEDKILVMRGIIGVISGIVSFILVSNEIFALLTPLLAYFLSIGVVYVVLNKEYLSKWDLLGRGISLLFASWLLIFVILYNA